MNKVINLLNSEELNVRYSPIFDNIIILNNDDCLFDAPATIEEYEKEEYSITCEQENDKLPYWCITIYDNANDDFRYSYITDDTYLKLYKLIKEA